MKKEPVSIRCHTYKGVHIPGCMGCAVYGHTGCTCPRAPKTKDLLAAIESLRKRLDASDQRYVELLRKVCTIEQGITGCQK